MQIFSDSMTSLWQEWELRVLVLLSLSWQVILIILGNRRKYSEGAFLSFTVWVIYLSADWLATVSLGNLANKSKIEGKGQVLQALWAPFLLLHLGGPDTITAYALEDNSLWKRHLLGLLVQATAASYVFLLSWGNNNALTLVAIPVFVSGMIKYSERTWALRAACPDQFEDARLSSALATQDLDLRYFPGDNRDLECLQKGYFLFPLLKHLYADLSLTFAEGRQSYSFLVKEREKAIREDAFKLVEVQLGFLFDVLYTKAAIVYSPTGLILRLISVLSIVAALVVFHAIIDNTYSRVDVAITYSLFVGAISIEVYAFISLMLSDWTLRWLANRKNNLFPDIVCDCIISCCGTIPCRGRRWSGYMGRLNLVDFCLDEKGFIGTNLFSKIRFEFNLLYQRQTKKQVDSDDDLKSLILRELERKYTTYKESLFDSKKLMQLLSPRYNHAGAGTIFKVIDWSFKVQFGHSILLWHVATDMCYHTYSGHKITAKYKASKKLSDYLFYILLRRPLMLPKWVGRIAHVRDTINHAIKLFHRRNFPLKDHEEACRMLIQLYKQSQFLDVLRREKSNGKSVLLDACCLASQLQNILGDDEEKLWETILEVWIEMLIHAASRLEWNLHAQQLRNGGEFLTHVSLLMAELGLSEHFVLKTEETPVDNQNEGCGWARTKLASRDASLLASSDDHDRLSQPV